MVQEGREKRDAHLVMLIIEAFSYYLSQVLGLLLVRYAHEGTPPSYHISRGLLFQVAKAHASLQSPNSDLLREAKEKKISTLYLLKSDVRSRIR